MASTTKTNHATLGMYDFLEAKEATDLLWQRIATECTKNGLKDMPQALSRYDGLDFHSLAESGSLVLGQTCGWPLLFDSAIYQVVGTPIYECNGCSGTELSSAIIVRKSSEIFDVDGLLGCRIAMNSRTSMTGCLLMGATLGRRIMESLKTVYTGAHIHSIEHVLCGRVDAAAIDSVTFAILAKYRPQLVEGLRILTYSTPGISLPFVTSYQLPADELQILRDSVKAAIQGNVDYFRENLFLIDFETQEITLESYKERVMSCQSFASALHTEVCVSILDQTRHAQHVLLPNLPRDSAFAETIAAMLPYDLAIHAGKLSCESVNEWTSTVDGRSVRLVYPSGRLTVHTHFLQLINASSNVPLPPCTPPSSSPSEPTIQVVCFLGHRPPVQFCPEDDHEAVGLCWRLDAGIVAHLDPAVVLAYVTGEVTPGGEWGNVVLLQPGKTADDFKASSGDSAAKEMHQQATQEVAARYYSHIRLHRGAFNICTGAISFSRTLCMRYAPLQDVARRGVLTRDITHWGLPSSQSVITASHLPSPPPSSTRVAMPAPDAVSVDMGRERQAVPITAATAQSDFGPREGTWVYDGGDSLASACLEALVDIDGSEPNSTGLPAGYEYLCSVEEAEPAFDESLHLSVSVLGAGISADSTPDITTLKDLGYDDAHIASMPTTFAQSSSFSVLAAAGIQRLREELVRLQPYIQSSPRIPSVLRGVAYRSRYIRSLCTSPTLTRYLSKIAGCALVPHPMGIMHGHTNLLPQGERRGERVDKWHRDTVTFVLIIFISPEDKYQGGKFEFFKGTVSEAETILQAGLPLPAERVCNIGGQQPGFGVFQQGWQVYHRAQAVTPQSEERTTFVLSFVPAEVRPYGPEACVRLSQTYNEIDPLHALMPDWIRFRCWRAQRLLVMFLRRTHDLWVTTASSSSSGSISQALEVAQATVGTGHEAADSLSMSERVAVATGSSEAGTERQNDEIRAKFRLWQGAVDARHKLLQICSSLPFTDNRALLVSEMQHATKLLRSMVAAATHSCNPTSAATPVPIAVAARPADDADDAGFAGIGGREDGRDNGTGGVDILAAVLQIVDMAIEDITTLQSGSSTMKYF